MDFSLSEEQKMIVDTFSEFSKREIRPLVQQLDKHPHFPQKIFQKLGELGLFSMLYPEPEGSGMQLATFILAIEQLAWGSLSIAITCTTQSLIGTYFLYQYAPEEIHKRWFEPALRGEKIGALCRTEADAGSDINAIRTKARFCNGKWFISGLKTWVTSAPVADFFTVIARTEGGHLSFFIVPRDASGLRVGPSIDLFGLRSTLVSDVFFEDTPALCLLGQQGAALSYMASVQPKLHILAAATALGISRAAFEDARRYASERRQFGKPIREFQSIQIYLADMATELQAARRLTHWAAWQNDQGCENPIEAAMAKLFTSESAQRICDRAARIFASYGFSNDYPVQRYLRDARFLLLGSGTSELLRVHIGSQI